MDRPGRAARRMPGPATPARGFCYKVGMLSYRHAFHAGNHADVLKHAVLVHLLAYLAQKDKPFWYVDTHAGAALHSLEEAFARKNAEYESGISRLWAREDLPAPLAAYVAQVRVLNTDAALRVYPGSAQFAMQMLRGADRVRLFELHSTESRLLQHHFRDDAPRVLVQAGDGFEGLKSVLPPPARRGLVLIDPSYEDKGDYRRVVATLEDALLRFATGVYAVWYPIVQRRVAGTPQQVEAPAAQGLAACGADGEGAVSRWLRAARQRPFRAEPALDPAQNAGRGDALPGAGPRAGPACGVRTAVRTRLKLPLPRVSHPRAPQTCRFSSDSGFLCSTLKRPS